MQWFCCQRPSGWGETGWKLTLPAGSATLVMIVELLETPASRRPSTS